MPNHEPFLLYHRIRIKIINFISLIKNPHARMHDWFLEIPVLYREVMRGLQPVRCIWNLREVLISGTLELLIKVQGLETTVKVQVLEIWAQSTTRKQKKEKENKTSDILYDMFCSLRHGNYATKHFKSILLKCLWNEFFTCYSWLENTQI